MLLEKLVIPMGIESGLVLEGLDLIAGGLKTVGGLFIGGVKDASEWANKLDSVSDLLGTTSQESAGLTLMSERLGLSVEETTTRFAKLTNGLIDSTGKLGVSGKALQSFGIDVFDANGKLRSSTEIIQEVADKISKMPDGLEKSSILMDLFGKSGAEMGDLLNAAANGGMQDFIQQADKLGLSFSDEKTQQLIEYQKKQEELKQTLHGLSVELGLTALPAFEGFADALVKISQDPQFREFLDKIFGKLEEVSTWIVQNIPEWTKKFDELLTKLGEVADWFSKEFPQAKDDFLGAWTVIATYLGGQGIPLFKELDKSTKNISDSLEILAQIMRLFGIQTSGTSLQAEILMGILNDLLYPVQVVYGWLHSLNVTLHFINQIWDAVNAKAHEFLTVMLSIQRLLSQFRLPAALTPGSPTPLEMGLRGINDAMAQINNATLPQFSQGLGLQPQMASAGITTTRLDPRDIRYLASEIIKARG